MRLLVESGRVWLALLALGVAACGDPAPPHVEPARPRGEARVSAEPQPAADPTTTEPASSQAGSDPQPSAEPTEPAADPPTTEPAAEPAADAEPAVDASGEEDDEDEDDEVIVPPRADGTLAVGPERDSPEEAAWAALSEDGGSLEASVAYRNKTFVLFTLPSTDAQARAFEAPAVSRVALYLARVRRVPGDDEGFAREAGVRLYDLALSGSDNQCEQASVAARSELRARDVDGDGEVEITVFAAVAAAPAPSRTYTAAQECGAVAFIVGGDDLNVQARFTREYHYEYVDAGGETYLDVETTWRLGDLNGDGRADLRVTESYRYRDTFSGDWGGDDVGTIPGHRTRASNRRSADCPYDVASDRWICPDPALGVQLFRSREELLRGGGPRLDRPSW